MTTSSPQKRRSGAILRHREPLLGATGARTARSPGSQEGNQGPLSRGPWSSLTASPDFVDMSSKIKSSIFDTRRTMGERHMVSTGVRWLRCGCGRFIGVALAEGYPVAVEPERVDPITELNALFAGRYSFDLIRMGRKTELMHRTYSRQRTRDYPVLLSHECTKVPAVEDPAELWKKKRADSIEPRPSPNSGAACPPPPF